MFLEGLQNLFLLLDRLVFGSFVRVKTINKEGYLKLKGPAIIVVNHNSWLDPFIVGLSFPWPAPFFPIKIGIWHKVFRWPILHRLFFSIWTTPVLKIKGLDLEITLKGPLKDLERGRIVWIFPQGKRRHYGRPRKARRGTSYLALRQKCPILSVFIKGTVGIVPKKFLLRKVQVKIIIGEEFRLPGSYKSAKDLKRGSEIITRKINELSLSANKNHVI